jgi:hypothetical protein
VHLDEQIEFYRSYWTHLLDNEKWIIVIMKMMIAITQAIADAYPIRNSCQATVYICTAGIKVEFAGPPEVIT